MKRRSNQKNYFIYTFLLLILSIGLGYALLQTNLNLNGLANLGINSWDIHFANVQVASGSVEATTPATINPQDNTKVNYAIKLNPKLIVLCAVFIVIIRGYMGYGIPTSWNKTVFQTILLSI